MRTASPFSGPESFVVNTESVPGGPRKHATVVTCALIEASTHRRKHADTYIYFCNIFLFFQVWQAVSPAQAQSQIALEFKLMLWNDVIVGLIMIMKGYVS